MRLWWSSRFQRPQSKLNHIALAAFTLLCLVQHGGANSVDHKGVSSSSVAPISAGRTENTVETLRKTWRAIFSAHIKRDDNDGGRIIASNPDRIEPPGRDKIESHDDDDDSSNYDEDNHSRLIIIAVVVPVCIILPEPFIIIWYRRRRRQKKALKDAETQEESIPLRSPGASPPPPIYAKFDRFDSVMSSQESIILSPKPSVIRSSSNHKVVTFSHDVEGQPIEREFTPSPAPSFRAHTDSYLEFE